MTVYTGYVSDEARLSHKGTIVVPTIGSDRVFSPFDVINKIPVGVVTSPALVIYIEESHPENKTAWTGLVGRTYIDDFYNKIHIIPSPLLLGVVLSTQSQPVILWNAYLIGVTLISQTPQNAAGITITPPAGLPLDFAALEQKQWSVDISLKGPSDINATVTFVFDVETVVLPIKGSRAVLLPWEPNWKVGVVETLTWNTTIIRSFSGKERRSALIKRPRKSLSYKLDLFSSVKASSFDAALTGFQNRLYGVPQWQDESALTTDAAAAATTLFLDTSTQAFSADASLMLFNDSSFSETAVIASVSPGQVELLNSTTLPWGAGTRVFPTQNGKTKDKVSFNRKGENLLDIKLSFDMSARLTDPFVSGGAISDTHQGVEVWLVRPNWADDLKQSQSYDVARLDSGFGVEEYLDTIDNANRQFTLPFLFLDRVEQLSYRQFLGRRVGMRNAFFIPSWVADFTPVSDIPPTGTTLFVEDNSYSLFTDLSPYRKHIYIETLSGTTFTREIISTSLNAGVLSLGLDSDLGVEVKEEEFKLVSFLFRARLSSDSVKISWITPKTSTSELPIEVIEE